ncbi:condensation domain-containing protein [Solihabitans fulvus]|uniref:condensation domain-containing protein n=1 Tax=Solihabitans fulvus TaxID=1892852 RepID=UPI001661F299|nr:condensation domain-containing protein [Solihabitans fulvus]
MSYREEVAWNEFNTDRATFFKRGAVLAVDLPPGLDAADVAALLDAVCARHAIFRTAYDTTAGRPVRHILPTHPHTVRPAGEPDETDRDRRRHLMPDDLLRAHAAPGPHGGTTLSLRLNEMITDTWSCARLRTEIELLGRGQDPPPLELGYADFATEERARSLPAASESYWHRQLAGVAAPLAPLPDGPDPSGDVAGERIVVFPDELTETLRAVCRRTRTSPFMVVTALVALAIASMGENRDVTVSTMASIRPAKWADVQGNFTNLTMLRTALPARPGFDDALSAARAAVLAAMARPVPYLRLAELTGGAPPIPPVRVHYLPSRAHHYNRTLDTRPSGASWVEEADFAEWPLDLGFAEDSRGRVAIWASYDPRRYTHAMVERLVDTCRRLLDSQSLLPR